MKKLEDFQNESTELRNIFGGGWVQTTQEDYVNSEGCTVKTTDSFDDKNGNGKLDKGESATQCISVSC
jgi:hypothetical protein